MSHKSSGARTWLRPLPALLATALLAGGCTRAVQIDSNWLDKVPHDQTFKNILVVGVHPDYNMRCRFERALAAELRSSNVAATASCALLGPKDPLTRETVEPVVRSLGADAVIATRLVASNVKAVTGTSADTRGGGYYKPVGYGMDTGYGYGINDNYYGYFGLPVTYVDFQVADPVTTLQRSGTIATNVYETKTAAPVYVLQTSVKNQDSQENAIGAATGALGDRLRRDGLVK